MKVSCPMVCVILWLAACLFFEGCTNSQNKQELRIIHAGSLTLPMKQIAGQFMQENQGTMIYPEAWGSKAGARRISELDIPCDVFISADYKVIDKMLIPAHATWNILFAGNEMAIVFNENSRYATEITSKNWYEILLKDGVVYGRSDPNSDPCGVRAVLCSKLAEKHYQLTGLANQIINRHTEYIRPKETDLLALLEKNAIDYIFLYRSVAEQHRLKYVVLPDEVNLKNPALNQWYSSVSVEVAGSSPTQKAIETGEAMVYGITIPTKTTNPKLALQFVEFFLSETKGLEILKKNGQQPMFPSVTASYGQVPEALKKFVLKPVQK